MRRKYFHGVALRTGMTAGLLGCFAVRAVRTAADWEEVARYYQFDSGFTWFPVFAAPFLVIIATAVSLWLRQDKALLLALISFGISGFFIFEEGLTVFARLMNANSGYVGMEPLLSIVVCAAAAGSALLSRTNQQIES